MHKFTLTGGWSGDSTHELHLLQWEQDFSSTCLPIPDAFNPQIQRTMLPRGIDTVKYIVNLKINAQKELHVMFFFFKKYILSTVLFNHQNLQKCCIVD